MSAVASRNTDPRALVEASQATRAFMGTPQDIGYTRAPANTNPRVRPMSRNTLRWTKAERAVVKELAGQVNADDIAKQLGRTAMAVRAKANKLGLGVSTTRKVNLTPHLDATRKETAQAIFAGCTKQMREIILDVSKDRGIAIEFILGTSRVQKVAHARQHLIWRIIRDTSMSMSGVALRLGLDHTTARHAVLVEDKRQGANVHAKRAANYVSWP